MPRNSSGTYALPAGNPVVTNTLIQSTWANTTLSDVSTAMTDSLDRNGRGAMLAPLKNIDGTATAPSLSFSSEGTMGIYRAAAGTLGFAVAGALVLSLTAAGLTFTAPIVLPIGTAAAPALTFIANTNTGIYSPGTSQVSISTAGVDRLAVGASGVVTLSSGALVLPVAGANFITASNAAGTLAFQTGGANTRVTIDATGNVTTVGAMTVGTSVNLSNAQAISWRDTGATSRRGAVLSTNDFYFGDVDNVIATSLTHVRANSGVTLEVNAATIMTANANGLGVGTAPISTVRIAMSDGTISTLLGYNYSANTVSGIGTNTAHALGFLTSGAERMRIDTSGNVGIGRVPGAATLDVQSAGPGIVRVRGGSGAAQGAAFYVTQGGTDTTLLAIGDLSAIIGGTIGTPGIWTNTGLPLLFNVGTSEKMRIDSNGSMVLNTTNPNGRELLIGGRAVVDIALKSTVASGGAGSSTLYFGNSATDGIGFINYDHSVNSLAINVNGGTRMTFTGGGNVTITNALTVGGITTSTATEAFRVANDGGFVSFFNTANNTRTGYLQGNAGANISLTSETGSLVLACSTGTINLQTSSTNRLTISSGGVIADGAGLELGWKDIPTNSQAGPYTLVVGDRGKCVQCGATGVTVPASVFAQGAVITISNNSGASQTITQGASVTLYFGATGGTGNRTLGPRGICTVLCLASNTFVITGAGLT